MDNKPQSPMEGRNVNEMNARGALNHSSVRVVKASELVLPFKGWYPGREYYIVPRGLDVGVFVDMSEVHRSIGPFSSLMWVTCRTWRDTVAMWHMACETDAVSILREGASRNASASAAATTSAPRPNTGIPAACRLTSNRPAVLASQSPTTTTSASTLTRRPPLGVVASDHNDDGNYDDSRESVGPCGSATALKGHKSRPSDASCSGYEFSGAASVAHAQSPTSNPFQPATRYKRASKKRRLYRE
ncbi:hypothetical protein HYPSUDRAFT_202862 [Hypholoma sublateritium FD-334 SS-4]|uniref:Uncharacterized protein n=1 Tax=Hypholoma sublateritium (strain FD-334 SS-4) TaxID=945553 RepID=A0A0D2NRT7_HYPSF|nr:hypothetical protein HYPSUDRAFT_202862 [Hypholoma sublateritium FD-334 SS-4]